MASSYSTDLKLELMVTGENLVSGEIKQIQFKLSTTSNCRL
jgi:hypothetical protein